MSVAIPSANERQVKRAFFALICLSLFVAISLVLVDVVCRNFDNGSADTQVQHQNHKLFAPTTDQPFYVLLIGSDSRKGTALYTGRAADHAQVDQHSDIMTLVRVDCSTSTITLLTIPRDTRMPDSTGKINDALLSNDPNEVVAAAERLLGIDIPGYIIADFSTFPKLVDDLGGVTVDVYRDITVSNPSTGENIKVTAGKGKTLTGDEALALARARKQYPGEQDSYRQLNVRNIETAIIEKVVQMNDVDSIRDAITYLRDDCSSNIDYAALSSVIFNFVMNRDQLTVYSTTGPYRGDYRGSDGIWICYDDPDTWMELIAAVDAGLDPSTVLASPQFK